MQNIKWYICSVFVLVLLRGGFSQNTTFYIEDNNLTPGQTVEVPVRVTDFDNVIGFQFTINWDTEILDFQSVGNFNLANLDTQDFGFSGVGAGQLTCAWVENSFTGQDLPDEAIVFSLSFVINCSANEASLIEFSDTPTDILLLYDDGNPAPASVVPTMLNGTFSLDGNPLSINPIISPISCAGQNDATIEANVSGGTAPYTYAWGGGGSNSSLENLGPGNYFLLVNDVNGCETVMPFITVDPVDSIQICETNISYDQSCNGSGACIDLVICEMETGLTYAWSNGETTAAVCNLLEGMYSVTVTNANGCSTQSEMILIEDNSYNPMSAQFSIQDSTCLQAGVIDLVISNGQGNYAYNWSNGSMESVAENLGEGEYFCTVTDEICELVIGPISVNAIPPDLTFTTEVIMPVCVEDLGAITVSAMSSAMPLTYEWNTGNQESELNDLSPGEYQLTITDTNGCFSISEIITIEAGVEITANAIMVDSTACNGSVDGSVEIIPMGGMTPYEFAFSDGSSQNPAILGAGTYEVTISDASGCSGVFENIQVFSPAALEITGQEITDYLDATNPGNINLMIAGGTAPYNYNWSNGGAVNPLENVAPGDYSCTITDANNCEIIVSDLLVDQIMSVWDLEQTQLKIYPNPSKGHFFVESELPINEILIWTVDGTLEKRLTTQNLNQELDLTDLEPGVYIMKCKLQNETIHLRCLIII